MILSPVIDRPPQTLLRRYSGVAILLTIGAMSVGLRLWRLDSRPLWVDEAFSVLYASIDWTEVVALRRTGTNPPLYHLALAWWVSLFGTSEASIRAPSVICSVLSMPLIWALGRRLFGSGPATLATALLAVSNLSVAYAQEARFYAPIQVLSLLASLLLVTVIDRQRWPTVAAYTWTMIVLVWTHTFGWFVLAAHLLWLGLALRESRSDPANRRRLLLMGLTSTGLVAIAFLPWVPILHDQVAGVRQGYWISEPRWSDLAVCLYDLLVWARPLRQLAGATAFAALLIGGASFARRRFGRRTTQSARPKSAPPKSCHVWGLLAWAAMPILIPFIWSKFATPIFQTKYAIVAQAPLLLLLAWAARRRLWLPIAAVGLLTTLYPPIVGRNPAVEGWRDVAAALREQTSETTPIYIHKDHAWFALDYYLHGDRTVIPVLPAGQTDNAFTPYYPGGGISFEEMLRQIAESNEPNLWLVLRWESPQRRRQIPARIAERRDLISTYEFAAVDVLQWGSRPAGNHATSAGRSTALNEVYSAPTPHHKVRDGHQ